jgi:exodeoxyribonuclease VII large subunit
MQQHLGDHHQHLAAVSRTLHTLSPLQTLGRGYAILRRYPQGELLRHTEQVHPGDRLEALLAEGQLICEVIDIPIS